mmetsp:Transcript_29600/g.50416  ORF Transcript_29600/g.50416 Transcript_29600/m.50416 type:complete len:210 (-) Transcript_29600:141-770(-)
MLIRMRTLPYHVLTGHSTKAPFLRLVFFVSRQCGRWIFSGLWAEFRSWIVEAIGTQWECPGRCPDAVEAEFEVAAFQWTVPSSPLLDLTSNGKRIDRFCRFIVKSRRRSGDELEVPSGESTSRKGFANVLKLGEGATEENIHLIDVIDEVIELGREQLNGLFDNLIPIRQPLGNSIALPLNIRPYLRQHQRIINHMISPCQDQPEPARL